MPTTGHPGMQVNDCNDDLTHRPAQLPPGDLTSGGPGGLERRVVRDVGGGPGGLERRVVRDVGGGPGGLERRVVRDFGGGPGGLERRVVRDVGGTVAAPVAKAV